jgi:hypothetical protein
MHTDGIYGTKVILGCMGFLEGIALCDFSPSIASVCDIVPSGVNRCSLRTRVRVMVRVVDIVPIE